MTLQASMSLRLDAGGSVTGLQANAGSALGEMDAVSLPDITQDVSLAEAHAGGIDLSAIAAGVQQAVSDLGPLTANLPVANEALSAVDRVIALSGQLGDLDLPASVRDLSAAIDGELAGSGDFLGKLGRLRDLLAGNPSVQGARELLAAFTELTGGDLNVDDLQVPQLIPAVLGGAQTLGGLMNLQTLLEEAQRLADVIDGQLDAGSIASGVAHVEAQLGLNGGQPLTGFIAGLDSGDINQVQSAKQAIENVAVAVRALAKAIAEGMAFGEATLVHLDTEGLKQAVQETAEQLGGVDLGPLENGAQALAERLIPLLSIDLGAAPAASLDEWLGRRKVSFFS